MNNELHAIVDYDDSYVQPIIVQALQSQLGSTCTIHTNPSTLPPTTPTHLLQIRSYETLDFEHGTTAPSTLMNAYVIRKALIRKHYLSNLVHQYTAKRPDSTLGKHFKRAEDFELDYAEFLDEALVECFELRASFERNEARGAGEEEGREWWILKPSMSDRGQGIRLFSGEEELRGIFEKWEEENPDSDNDDGEDDDDGHDASNQVAESEVDDGTEAAMNGGSVVDEHAKSDRDYIVTSHLRHFIVQPYIHPPLLLPDAPYNNRKFHIRTYVVAAGALRVYVYGHMLALFASEPYSPPRSSSDASETDGTTDNDVELLQRMRNIHLTNTCVQKSLGHENIDEDNVFLLSKLLLPTEVLNSITQQIRDTTCDLFCAAASQPTNFQALGNAFEVFGLDFLVDEAHNVWLLEVNAFPDFKQTGEELKEVVIRGLWEDIVKVVVRPHFDGGVVAAKEGSKSLLKVLDLDMGRG